MAAPPAAGGLNHHGLSRAWPSVAHLTAIPAGFVAGSVPFSNLAAHRTRGVDLRDVGTGTVSGTALYEQAGFLPLAATPGALLHVAVMHALDPDGAGELLAGRSAP
jgi:hypothetical protein